MTDIVKKFDRSSRSRRRRQLRQHAAPPVVTGLGRVVLAENRAFAMRGERAGIALSPRRAKYERRWQRMIAHPELVARQRPSIANRPFDAAVSAATGSLTKGLTGRAKRKIVPVL
jgi:hypothetical protein